MKNDTKKNTLRALLLAAAAVAPQMVWANNESSQIKHLDEFSQEEINTIEFPSVKCIIDSKNDDE